MKVTRTSLLSGITRTMEINITEQDIHKIEKGQLLRPTVILTPEEIEFIKTGIIPQEWNNIFEAL